MTDVFILYSARVEILECISLISAVQKTAFNKNSPPS